MSNPIAENKTLGLVFYMVKFVSRKHLQRDVGREKKYIGQRANSAIVAYTKTLII